MIGLILARRLVAPSSTTSTALRATRAASFPTSQLSGSIGSLERRYFSSNFRNVAFRSFRSNIFAARSNALVPSQGGLQAGSLCGNRLWANFQQRCGYWSKHAMKRQKKKSRDNTLVYGVAWGLTMFGLLWLMIPLYEILCQSSGIGSGRGKHSSKAYEAPKEDSGRVIEIDFSATVGNKMPWKFWPEQKSIRVGIGETALAFFKARNMSDKPVIGMAVYHMIPPESGLHFNKIQCFCFEEQLLNPNEEVDMPVFFFVDPLFEKDRRFDSVNRITLSYIFYESTSELPEEYKHLSLEKARPTTQLPPTKGAPEKLQNPDIVSSGKPILDASRRPAENVKISVGDVQVLRPTPVGNEV